MKQYVVINDAALGQWKLEVAELSSELDGTYAFAWYGEAIDLHTGEVCKDEAFVDMLADYALDEGYKEQNISAQCGVLWDNYFAAA